MALAVATNTMPSAWENETPENVLTAVHIIHENNERNRRRG